MANELRVATTSGETCYALLINGSGQFWNGSAFETFVVGNYATYPIMMTEKGTTGIYMADFPASIVYSGTFGYIAKIQVGGSPAQSDTFAGSVSLDWTGSLAVMATSSITDLVTITTTGSTCYGLILDADGKFWNGLTFETLTIVNYTTYAVPLVEIGTTGIYGATFPSLIPPGSYEYFVKAQSGAFPVQGDTIVSSGAVDWSGTPLFVTLSGWMTGPEWVEYVKRCGFKRADKDTEIYEETSDAIREMRRRFMFNEAQVEKLTTESITTAGDFQITLEPDSMMLLGITVEDGSDYALPLKQVSKHEFNNLYPYIHNDPTFTGVPKHFCIFAGNIEIGPIPDKTTYLFRLAYSTRCGAITSTTVGVPFTKDYRDILHDNVMGRLYKSLDEFDKAQFYTGSFENGFVEMVRLERANQGLTQFNVRPFGL